MLVMLLSEKVVKEGEEEEVGEEEEGEEEIEKPKHNSSLFLMFQCLTAAVTAIVALNSYDKGNTAWESYTNLQGLIANSCVTTTLASSFLGLAEMVADEAAGRKCGSAAAIDVKGRLIATPETSRARECSVLSFRCAGLFALALRLP